MTRASPRTLVPSAPDNFLTKSTLLVSLFHIKPAGCYKLDVVKPDFNVSDHRLHSVLHIWFHTFFVSDCVGFSRILHSVLTPGLLLLVLFYSHSARGQDTAAPGGVEEGVGRSGELHLWPEGGLQQAFPRTEGCYVSHMTLFNANIMRNCCIKKTVMATLSSWTVCGRPSQCRTDRCMTSHRCP